MKNYVIRLSASGVLCLTSIGCGTNETQVTSLSESDSQNKKLKASPAESNHDVNCDKTQENSDLELYLKELQKQGRLTDCDVEVQFIDQSQVSLPPESEI